MLTVLIDDVRRFRDGRDCMAARSSAAGVALLESLRSRVIDELWLDHDLVAEDTIMPVVDLLVSAPLDVRAVVIHTANVKAGVEMNRRITAAGYATRWCFDVRTWRWSTPDVVRPVGDPETSKEGT